MDQLVQWLDRVPWTTLSGTLASRLGVFAFLPAIVALWVAQTWIPRRFWHICITSVSVILIGFATAPWPVDGAYPRMWHEAEQLGSSAFWTRAVYGALHAAAVVAVLVLAYWVAQIGAVWAARPGAPRWRIALAATAPFVAIYVSVLQYRTSLFLTDAPVLERAVLFPSPQEAGLAFMLVKLVQYLIDSCLGRNRHPNFWEFMSWMTFFPAYRSGPMERYEAYRVQMDSCHGRVHVRELVPGIVRMATGVVKLGAFFAAIPFVLQYILSKDTQPEQLSYARLWIGVWLVTISAYVQFSAYCDLAIGMARLLGYRMQENFRFPMLARNIQDLWSRVHMTMSTAMRDYVFVTLLRRGPLAFGEPTRDPDSLSSRTRRVFVLGANYYIAFVICGLWHLDGSPLTRAVNTVVWGLAVASGVIVFEVWRMGRVKSAWRQSRLHAALERIRFPHSGVARVLSTLLTLNFFSVTLIAMVDPGLFVRLTTELIGRPVRNVVQWIS